MIVSFSDAHDAIVRIVADSETEKPGIGKYVLTEIVSAVHHLCDQYDLDFERVLAEAASLYRHQQDRDLNNLEQRE